MDTESSKEGGQEAESGTGANRIVQGAKSPAMKADDGGEGWDDDDWATAAVSAYEPAVNPVKQDEARLPPSILLCSNNSVFCST